MVGGLAVFLGLAARSASRPQITCFTDCCCFVLGVIDDRLEIDGPSVPQALIITGYLIATSVQVSDLGLGTRFPLIPD